MPLELSAWQTKWQQLHLTFLGRAVLLMTVEILANILFWVLAACLFRDSSLLSYCLIAWTLGLRHALDADHLCAIDLSLRRLLAINPGQVPVTVGMFFSLGHSTIVIVATIWYIQTSPMSYMLID
jgi:high-affinity nickel-transport protein